MKQNERPNAVALEGNGARPSHHGIGFSEDGLMYTLNSTELHYVCYSISAVRRREEESLKVTNLDYHPNDSRIRIIDENTCQSLTSRMGTGGNNVPQILVDDSLVRKLTERECERLQNFPDDWTDIGEWIDTNGKLHKTSSASARYKALGNAICLPFWSWLLKRISAQYERNATMGSLFSGIGGFDLCWMRCNGHGSVLWESEIEEFPIAVCKRHFGDEDTGEVGDVQKYL